MPRHIQDREAIHDVAFVQQFNGFVSDSVRSAPLCATAPLCAEQSLTRVGAENAFFSGCNLLSQGNVSQAIPDLEKAVESDPENSRYLHVLAVAYHNLGLRLTRQGKVRNGILFLAKALNVVPDDKEIRSNFVQAVLEVVTAPEERIRLEEKVAFLKQP
jgi:tetratricopeptide (TPR) repeat protein